MPSLHFLCPQCDARLGREAGEPAQPCDACRAESAATAPPPEAIIDRCAACGHGELYFQKDFNRATGMAMVCPLTNTDRGIPFHVPVAERTVLTGFVMVEQIKSVDYRARKAWFAARAPVALLEEVQAILDACLS